MGTIKTGQKDVKLTSWEKKKYSNHSGLLVSTPGFDQVENPNEKLKCSSAENWRFPSLESLLRSAKD